jgi:hypothetical protein
MAKETVKYSELQLGDQVQFFDDAYSVGTVKRLTKDSVEVYRPYVHTADFVYGGDDSSDVICYIGTETIKLWRDADRTITRLCKGPALK